MILIFQKRNTHNPTTVFITALISVGIQGKVRCEQSLLEKALKRTKKEDNDQLYEKSN